MLRIKIIALSAIVLAAMTGCSKVEPVVFTDMPPELADCKFFHMANLEFGKVLVSRCPNSTTTVTANSVTSVVESREIPDIAPSTLTYKGQAYVRLPHSDAVPQ